MRPLESPFFTTMRSAAELGSDLALFRHRLGRRLRSNDLIQTSEGAASVIAEDHRTDRHHSTEDRRKGTAGTHHRNNSLRPFLRNNNFNNHRNNTAKDQVILRRPSFTST